MNEYWGFASEFGSGVGCPRQEQFQWESSKGEDPIELVQEKREVE